MEHKTWITVDKSSWGAGPWQDEPDKEQFTDEVTGLPCLIRRSPTSGALCGYIGVPEGHPWHGSPVGDILADVHGDLTYAGFCQEGPEEDTICHIPSPGEPDRVYWIGFDCAHYADLCPGMNAYMRKMGDPPDIIPGVRFSVSYKPIAYVKAECASLAWQAVAASLS